MIFLRQAMDAFHDAPEAALEFLKQSAVPYEAAKASGWTEERIEEVEVRNFACLFQSKAGVFWIASNNETARLKSGFPAFSFRELRDFWRVLRFYLSKKEFRANR